MTNLEGTAEIEYVLAFRDGISITRQGGVATVEAKDQSVPLRRLSPGVSAALSALSEGGATESAMASAAEASDGPASAPLLFYYLERFKALGFVTFSAGRPGARIATLVRLPSAGARALPAAGTPDPAREYQLSRFAYLRRDGAQFVIESPLAHCRVVLHDKAAVAVCHALSAPRTVAALSEICPAGPAVLGLLLACRAACAVDGVDERAAAGGDPPSSGSPEGASAEMWSFHDLLFHARSRFGRHIDPVGATFRFADRREPLPALKPPMTGARVELFRPDLETLKATDLPLTCVLEERRSIRAYGERPLHVRHIGELLYRAARVRASGVSSSAPSYPTTSRPYPGGGACYELELYLAVRACDGLAEGLYHYEPQEHALTALSGRTAALDPLLFAARAALAAPEPPQVMIVMTARFGRVMWKYESMAYAMILKDVGVLFQTLYLVATAMGLAPAGLGTGDSDLFAAAAGLDPLTEASVGEMALGSRPSQDEKQ